MNSRAKYVVNMAIATPEELPLRNFIKCNKCTRMLTGSASKGRKRYSIYYHCRSSCGVRHRAEDINNAFMDELIKFVPVPGMRSCLSRALPMLTATRMRPLK
ncbi:zinc ribbon domain-containing protein [Parapedobacter indicus]